MRKHPTFPDVIVAAGAAVVLTSTIIGTAVQADFSPGDEHYEAYRQDRICYAPQGDNLDGPLVRVVDTFTIVDSYFVPNVGTTSMSISPCLPTACPDGYTLVSTACFGTDPFAHVPFDDADTRFGPDDYVLESTVSTVPLSFEVGPLVEPAIATVAS